MVFYRPVQQAVLFQVRLSYYVILKVFLELVFVPVFRLIKEIKEQYRLSIFMIEHHMDLVMGISDRVYVLDFGSLIAEGTPEMIQKNQRVIDAYLGVSKDV